jgi:hypothetical protein
MIVLRRPGGFFVAVILLLIVRPPGFSQSVAFDSSDGGSGDQRDRVVSFSVRDQPIDQVLLAFAERSGLSIVTDATVSGTVSLVLHHRSSREVLQEIAAAGELFVTERNGVFWLSRIYLEHHGRDRWELRARNASLAAIVQRIASRCGITILGVAESDRVFTLTSFGTTPTDLIDNLSEEVGYTRIDRGNGHLLLPRDRSESDTPAWDVSPREDETDHRVEIRHTDESGYCVSVGNNVEAITVLEALAEGSRMTLITGGAIVGRCPPFELEETTWERLSERLESILGVTLARDGDLLLVQPRIGEERFTPFRRRAILNTGHLSSVAVEEIIASEPDLDVEWNDPTGGRVVVSGFEGAIRSVGDLLATIRNLEIPPERLSYRCRSADAETVAQGVEALFPEIEVRTGVVTNTVSAAIPGALRSDIAALVTTLDSEERRLVYRCRYTRPETAITAVVERFPPLSRSERNRRPHDNSRRSAPSPRRRGSVPHGDRPPSRADTFRPLHTPVPTRRCASTRNNRIGRSRREWGVVFRRSPHRRRRVRPDDVGPVRLSFDPWLPGGALGERGIDEQHRPSRCRYESSRR